MFRLFYICKINKERIFGENLEKLSREERKQQSCTSIKGILKITQWHKLINKIECNFIIDKLDKVKWNFIIGAVHFKT